MNIFIIYLYTTDDRDGGRKRKQKKSKSCDEFSDEDPPPKKKGQLQMNFNLAVCNITCCVEKKICCFRSRASRHNSSRTSCSWGGLLFLSLAPGIM